PAFAQHELGVTGQRELAQRVAVADGRIGRLLADGNGRARGVEAGERFRRAVEGGPARRYEFALGLQPFQARGGFTEMLDGLLEQLREQARSGGGTEKVVAAMSRVRAAAKAVGRTGVEMEALTAVSVALLTVYDMVKAADRAMEIEKVRLLEKTGGTRGDWRRDAAD